MISQTVRRFHQSIITKLFFVSLLILISVGGITAVSLLSFQHVGNLLITMIDTKVSRTIENANLGRELSDIFADTDLLLRTFLEQEDVLKTEGERLIETLHRNVSSAITGHSEELKEPIQNFIQALQVLLEQCVVITEISQHIRSCNNELESQLTKLEDLLSEKILILVTENTENESFAIDQLAAMTPEYRNILAQITIQIMTSTQAHLGLQTAENTYVQRIRELLENFKINLRIIASAGKDFVPLGKTLTANAELYEERILALHQAMSEFQTRLIHLKKAQNQVTQVMAEIDKEVSLATVNIRQDVSKRTKSSRTMILSLSVAIIIFLSISGYYALNMIRPVVHLSETANQLAQGNITTPLHNVSAQDEIGILANSFRNMVSYIRDIAGITEKISEGNLQVNVIPKSRQDALNISLQKLVNYIQNVAQVTEKIAQKDLHVTVSPKSEHDILNSSLQRMVTNLQTMMEEIEQQNWLKDGINQLNIELSGEISLQNMCNKAVSFVARYTNAGQGVLYLYNEEQKHLKLYGTFAFTDRDIVSNKYKLGEGIIGQAALERSPIFLRHLSQEDALITTGTVNEAPLNTYTFPLIYNEELYGVIELASFEPFNTVKQMFLNESNLAIATALFTAIQREQSQQLLQNTSAVIQAQQDHTTVQQ